MTRETWIGHILVDHAEMEDLQRLMIRCLESPDVVNYDRDFENRESFYLLDVAGTRGNRHIKVCVDFGSPGGNQMAQERLAFPDMKQLDPDKVVIRYVEDIDTLFIHFYGTGQPGVSEQIDEYVYLRLDPNEQRVIGIQIEGFLRGAVADHPELLSLAQFAGIRSELLEIWSAQDSARSVRIGLLDSILEQWSYPATA